MTSIPSSHTGNFCGQMLKHTSSKKEIKGKNNFFRNL